MKMINQNKKQKRSYKFEEKLEYYYLFKLENCGYKEFENLYNIPHSSMRGFVEQIERKEQKIYERFIYEVEKEIGDKIHRMMMEVIYEGKIFNDDCEKQKLKKDIKRLFDQYFQEKQDFIHLLPKRGKNKKKNITQDWIEKQMKIFDQKQKDYIERMFFEF